MSYARFRCGCDVYVYLDTDGYLNCCGCRLQQRRRVESPGLIVDFITEPVGEIVPHAFTTTAAMLCHLDAHRAQGHDVPASVTDDLRADADANDAWMREQSS